ncbi:hypothetical protein CPT_Moonbeam16 [Bacillus phage Moonbeam]|uniref:DUF3603 family protein n=1 Tax=Bacillus phage Moonbeam TaxID=1540091 RepID=A0A0A0RP53_9CAUD|nr:hypothetical protein CPT_Moonbeam16 [Bacillus phage Moonbeam]AIW03414.1 hypothetical protein CPT_Moonbeam16 [Bacillus phage Moonbeam]
MLYIHDVWVNWFEGAVNGYEVPEFEAWRKDDVVELLDQSPLLYVTEELFDYVENGMNELPSKLLKAIHQKGYIRRNHERSRVEHLAVLTDGLRILVIDTDAMQGEGDEEDIAFYAYKKSRLIPRQYQLVLEMIEDTEPTDFGVQFVEEEAAETTDGIILNITNVHMIGLTRREAALKELLVDCLYQLSQSSSLEEVRYWYTELFPGSMIDITTENWSIEKMVLDMHDHLSEGWDEQHVAIGYKLSRYFQMEDDWKDTAKDAYKATGVKVI